MKKLVILNNNLHNTPHVLEFAIATAEQYGYEVEGLFLKVVDGPRTYPFPNDLRLTEESVTSRTVAEENEKIMQEYIDYFRGECERAGVVHKVTEASDKNFFKLANSADAFLIDARYQQHMDDPAGLISRLHCPVIAVSDAAEKIDQVIFGFDGSEDAEHAIRKYIDLFPQSDGMKFHLVTVNKEMEFLEHRIFINEFLEKKFKGITIHHLEGDQSTVFIDFVRQSPDNTLVVMGAYGRSSISRFFRPSLAEKVFHETRCSLFLAHRG